MASDTAFQPEDNSVCISTSTTSAAIQMQSSPTMVVTNRSDASAWVTWNHPAPPTAVFPTPNDPVGAWGMEVPARAQVTIGVAMQNTYVAGILESGNGVMSFTPGDGL